jgi:hypothetical protein
MEPTIPNHINTINEHIVDISRDHNVASSSNSISHNNNNHEEEEEEFFDEYVERGPPSSSSSSSEPPTPNLRNTTVPRRGDGLQRRHRSPVNSGLWISIELVVNFCQIVAAIVVLSLSKHEHPHAPLFQWVIGYTAGCVATLPHLYWRYVHRNHQGSNQEAGPAAHQSISSQNNSQAEANSYTAVSTSNRRLEGTWRNNVITRNPRYEQNLRKCWSSFKNL